MEALKQLAKDVAAWIAAAAKSIDNWRKGP